MTTDGDHIKQSPNVTGDQSQSDAAQSMRNRWQKASEVPTPDPGHVISYLISGVTIWGAIGWAAARWLDIPALTGVGFIIGGVLGIWLTYIRYGRPQSGSSTSMRPAQPDLPRASALSRSQSAQSEPRTSGPQSSSDTTAEEEKP